MKSDPIVLDPAPQRLWLEFQARDGLLPRSTPVLEHWRRSKALGAPLVGPAPDDLLWRGTDLAERIERLDPLLACGRQVLARVAAAASDSDHVLLFADPEGVIVHTDGGRRFRGHAQSVRLIEGADWGEARRGTNAIGTVAATGRPVFVRGGAHYARDYRDLVCYAAPVRDPDGGLMGVLDVTSFHSSEDPSLGAGVIAAARALEEVLRMRAWARAGDALNRAVARSLERMNCPVAVIEPPGRVTRANGPARELFGGLLADGEVEAVLGLDFDGLVATARAGARDAAAIVVAPRSGRSFRVRLEPIETDERLVALLTFFEPLAEGRPVAAPEPADATVNRFPGLFAEDAPTRAALEWAARIAPSDVPVMLLAETGAGKELVARGVHGASRRADGPFVAVNCGSIAPSLLESELFGYAPGAFTGAERGGREGYLDAASGGTLFLDEVADMPLAMQAALLRVLETGQFQRVGEACTRTADVRVVCATCRDLGAMVASGAFRQDLYFRLKGALVTLPALRQRGDLRGLADHLLGELARAQGSSSAPRLSDAVARRLDRHSWPGNVRELKTSLEVALVLADGATSIEPEHLPPELAGESVPAPVVGDRALAPGLGAETVVPVPPKSRAEAEADALARALEAHDGSVTGAARQLGVARSTLYRMLRRHGMDRRR